MTEEQVLDVLRREIDRAGSQAAYAKGQPFSASMLAMTLRGERRPSQAILDALKIERVRGVDTYRRKSKEAANDILTR